MKTKKHSHRVKKYFSFLITPYKKLKLLENKNEKNKALFKDIKNVIIVLLCNFLFIVGWVNRSKFYPENVTIFIKNVFNVGMYDSAFPYKINENMASAENFQFFEKNISLLGNTNFDIITKNGKILKSEKHSFSSPCLKTRGLRAIIYDRGGKNYKIESTSDTLFEGTSNKNIISCALSEIGTFAVAEQSSSHLSEMGVYNKNGKEKYKYYFSDYYLSDIALNSFGTEGAACGITGSNGSINSNIYVLNFNSETPKKQFLLTDNMITKVEYLQNGNILAIGDKYMAFLHVNSGTVNKFEYGNKFLKFYDINREQGVCCCLSSSVNETSNDEIIMLDTTGKELFKTKTSENFSGISKYKNRVIGITKNKIISYNFQGKYEGYMDFYNNAKKVLLTSHSNAYVLENGNINKIKIKNLKKD